MSYDPNFNFNQSVKKIFLTMPILATAELEKIPPTVEMAHSIGPFFDPTAYHDALQRGDMDVISRLALALQKAVEIWNEEIAPKIGG